MANGVITLHGNEYQTVAFRVQRFREKHSIEEGWGITTEIITCDSERVVVKATISNEKDRHTVATGIAEEIRSNRGINAVSALENCETSAIGRALAAAGFAGTVYASADEVRSAMNQDKPEIQTTVRWTTQERSVFLEELQNRKVDPSALERFTQSQKWGSVGEWSTEDRDAFLSDMDQGAFPDLYKPQPAKPKLAPQRLPTPTDKRRSAERAQRQARTKSHNWDRTGGSGPKGACLNKACSAIRGQGHDENPCPVIAPGEKHPEFTQNQRWFFGSLKQIMGRDPDYAQLAITLERHGCKRPSACSYKELVALLEQLKSPNCPEFLRHFTANPPQPLDMS